jgi:8-oxo-dGTP pyrophosphatase MutT (NUDIX family)
MIAAPRDAASVILLRQVPSPGGIEILLVKRHTGSDFAGGMYVFPGGELEESDCSENMAALCAGILPGDAASIIEGGLSPRKALGLYVAGIRETFEETGILLAYHGQGELVSHEGTDGVRFAAYREELRSGGLSFLEMISGEGLRLACDRMAYFAHWITPEISPIRFDTRFFLAPSPPGQNALHDAVETTAHLWISPREALEKSERGDLPMLLPTIANLKALAPFTTIEDALTSTAGKDIPTILPKISFENGRARLLLPGDLDQA